MFRDESGKVTFFQQKRETKHHHHAVCCWLFMLSSHNAPPSTFSWPSNLTSFHRQRGTPNKSSVPCWKEERQSRGKLVTSSLRDNRDELSMFNPDITTQLTIDQLLLAQIVTHRNISVQLNMIFTGLEWLWVSLRSKWKKNTTSSTYYFPLLQQFLQDARQCCTLSEADSDFFYSYDDYLWLCYA